MFKDRSDGEKDKFSFVRGLTYPLMTINENLFNFLVLIAFFSLVSSSVGFLIGRSFMCGFLISTGIDVGVFCSENNFIIAFSIMINVLLISLYLSRIPLIGEKYEKKLWFLQKLGWKKEIKSLGMVGLYLLFWGIVCFFGAVLKLRQPTPDWGIELAFFIVCSLGIILALIALLLFSGVLNCLHGGSLSDIKKVFWIAFDEIFKLIFWFLIYLLIFVFLFADAFKYFVGNLSLFSVVASEFCFYLLLYLMIAVIYFSYEYQEKRLFVKEK